MVIVSNNLVYGTSLDSPIMTCGSVLYDNPGNDACSQNNDTDCESTEALGIITVYLDVLINPFDFISDMKSASFDIRFYSLSPSRPLYYWIQPKMLSALTLQLPNLLSVLVSYQIASDYTNTYERMVLNILTSMIL